MTKRIVEDAGDVMGLEAFLGRRVLLICGAYFYAGVLKALNKSTAELADASIVYETGPWGDAKYKDAQLLGTGPHYVRLAWIESFREGK